MSLFAHDLQQIKRFAAAYLITTIVGCVVAVVVLDLSAQFVVENPTLTGTGIIRLGMQNYHWFAYALSYSMIFVIAFASRSQQWLMRLLLLFCIGYLAYFLLLAGSRQAIVGMVLSIMILLIILVRRHPSLMPAAALTIIIVTIIAIVIYQMDPYILTRSSSDDLLQAFDIYNNRGELWHQGIDAFLRWPLWGDAYQEQNWAHNLFISVLADQGVIGAIFMVGFLVFFVKLASSTLHSGDITNWPWPCVAMCIVLFDIVHGQASGTVLSSWAMYWGTLILWFQQGSKALQAQELCGNVPKYDTPNTNQAKMHSL
jgi:O-antigen ligase